jgi:hypothetical protein
MLPLIKRLLDSFNKLNIFKSDVNINQQSIEKPLKNIIKRGYETNIFLYDDLSKYVNGEQPSPKQIIWVTLARACCLLTAIRFLLLSFFNNKLMSVLMTDVMYGSGNHTIICVIMSLLAINSFLIGSAFQYHEMSGQMPGYKFIVKLFKNEPPIRISYSQHQRITFALHLSNKYLIRLNYKIALTIGISITTYLSIRFITQMYSWSSLFTILMAILWIIPTYFMLQQNFALINFGPNLIIFALFYLKYAFIDIEKRIRLCKHFRNPRLLSKLIAEHNTAVKICVDFNQILNKMIFFIYYLLSPIDMLVARIILSDETLFIARIGGSIIVVFGFSIIFLLTCLFSQIKTVAHRPYHLLHSLMCSKTLSVSQRIKIMTYIERLCGPDIGFYCYDLFPMNNYEFYLYITNCVKNYILFDDLLASFK